MTEEVSTQPQVQQAATQAATAPFKYNNYYLNEFGVLGFLALQGIVYPLERIKVLQQVDIIPEIFDESGKYSHRQNFESYYNRHLESDTFEAFYRGLAAKLTKLVAKELSIYTIADRIRDKIQVFDAREDPFKHTAYNLISAALSSMLIETAIYPLELAKTRILCDGAAYEDRVYSNIYQALTKDSATSKTSIFHGALFSLLGAAVYRGTQIGLYETLLNLGLRDSNPWLQLPTSVLLTIFAQRISYPFDTIRRQLMLKNTPFEVTSAELDTILKRMTHPARQKDLMRGWNMQFYKSISTGIFLFAYKAFSGTFNAAPDLISRFTS